MSAKTFGKIDHTKVKRGHMMALVYWVEVQAVYDGGADLRVRDIADNKDFEIHGFNLVKKCYSADVYEKEVKTTKTDMAEKLIAAHNMPFTVEFEKADGTIRMLRGKLISPEPLMGRSTVLDFDVQDKDPLRLVDHRSIKSLILDNVKYVLK